MKKLLFFLSLLVVTATGFAENIVLKNQTSYPKNQKSKIAVQWASTEKEVDESNKALMNGLKLNPDTMQVLKQTGKIKLSIPNNAQYFRVIAWSKGDGEPDFHTNWVDVVPNKTYTLQEDHLVPTVLMSGTGC